MGIFYIVFNVQVVKDQVCNFNKRVSCQLCADRILFITECRVYMYRSVGIMLAIISVR